MDWASLIIALISAVVAAGSFWVAFQARRAAEKSAQEAKRANDLTVLYKDPHWELTAATENEHFHAGGPMVELVLTNRGESPGRDVTMTFDFDPTNMHISPQSWPFIDRGDHVNIPTSFIVQEKGISGSVWNNDVAGHPDRNAATVSWVSPAGEQKSQRVKLPQCSRYTEPDFVAPETV